ncbi:serine hydrolase domain-containing protein [Pseudonocardia alaniniphila]|uniref:Beta-lactamase family protein n=1 Tax=Pseudonocardia alaniniphila TaxID=75291 RepID=A0ABS9TGW1_9PSEU|nr:beta-lactamase family protein [Pseudonocardia alaniniphila]MCH6167774.1 beta-lactamase family protein [Pseudonocardia alaniniphila]
MSPTSDASNIDIEAIDALLRKAVDAGTVPSLVAIAADRRGVIYEGAAGSRVPGAREPVSADTVYRMQSMTKIVTTVAALQLVEQGALDLDAPVETYRPEFAEVQVLDGFDGDTPRLRPPASRVTVRHLVTHTSGLVYSFFNADIDRWEKATGTPSVVSGKEIIFTAPLATDPGTRFEYGISTDWLGRVIEAVSGVTLDVAFERGLTGPLGMHDTRFAPTDEQRLGLSALHAKADSGEWVEVDDPFSTSPEFWGGGHGLYSTPRDFLRFQRMLLDDGTFEGTPVLKPATVEAAFSNQIGDLEIPPSILTADPRLSLDFILGPGFKWGYGLMLNTTDFPGMRRAGSGAWAGLMNTYYWIDRTAGITAAIYSQFLPFADPEMLAINVEFEKALYAGL